MSSDDLIYLIMIVFFVIVIGLIVYAVFRYEKYKELETQVLKELGFSNWHIFPDFDAYTTVKSRQALEKYDEIKYFKENKARLSKAEKIIEKKLKNLKKLRDFLENNQYQSHPQYNKIVERIESALTNSADFIIRVDYISRAGNNLAGRKIPINQTYIERIKNDPTLLMTKSEYNQFVKNQKKELLDKKHCDYYEKVSQVIDFANQNKDSLIINGSQKQLDDLIDRLFEKTVNSIKKIKTIDSEEWTLIGKVIDDIKEQVEKIVNTNQRILEYYNSSDFVKIKEACEALMSSQREFNEYINEKVQSVSRLFGTRVIRDETINDDEYNYIRPYKKTVTPFTAEVSASVFASAENNPLEYIVKYFYPNKKAYPEQIQKLCQLVEELETLRDAKQIIENYKKEYQQYLGDVPDFIMEEDEAGFYSRLGFATIDESVLTVEYKFSYTSGGGMAQRSFTVPMTEETIANLIDVLNNKLTASAFVKEQRTLMTQKLREDIKVRDDYTCRMCGNSTKMEPNLLLEIDHIIPVSKGGRTVKENLQTLCWKCNRAKRDKIIDS